MRTALNPALGVYGLTRCSATIRDTVGWLTL